MESTYSCSSFVRVGVVEAHVARAAVVAGEAEVQADRFRVAEVQVAVRFRREAGADPGGIVRGAGLRCAAGPGGRSSVRVA
jgi:hypothetical protein